MKAGIIILSELQGALRARVLDIQERYDPKLAASLPPHLTLTGSSGMGPIPAGTSVAELRNALEPIARDTAPMTLPFLKPMRFMQTNIVVLPLDPNGAIRALHDRIKSSGLRYEQPRFTFTPHVTLSFFSALEPDALRELMRLRFDDQVVLNRIAAYQTTGAIGTRKLLELELTGST